MNFTILLLVSIFGSFTVTVNSDSVEEIVKRIQDQMAVMEFRLKATEVQILDLTNKGNTRVAFSAWVEPGSDAPTGPFTTDTTLIYNSVQTNIGNGYNPATGIFTAPVAGVYYFSIFFHTDSNLGAQLQLFKNSQGVLLTQDFPAASAADRADNGGNAVSLQLQRGDQVSVRLTANKRVWGNSQLTTFNGFLLSEM